MHAVDYIHFLFAVHHQILHKNYEIYSKICHLAARSWKHIFSKCFYCHHNYVSSLSTRFQTALFLALKWNIHLLLSSIHEVLQNSWLLDRISAETSLQHASLFSFSTWSKEVRLPCEIHLTTDASCWDKVETVHHTLCSSWHQPVHFSRNQPLW